MSSRGSDRDPLVAELETALAAEPIDLASVALLLARLEYPGLDPAPYLDLLDRLGREARKRVGRVRGWSIRARVAALNGLIFNHERFAANRGSYDDFRNSYLNAVLERRLGIPITLALVYMEVAQRVDMDVQGVSFPGHFLMLVAGEPRGDEDGLLLDPFAAGAEMDLADCGRLLAADLGQSSDDQPLDPALLRPCTRRHMVGRMLNNLKRTYLEQHSYGRARRVTDLLLAVEPSMLSELRDRGLLAYHLDDCAAALRDLEDYHRLRGWKAEPPDQEERDQILDHIKTLRRRLAGWN
jgi:regulator of sirC expression with transglutaminase-like and TPR domain